MNMNTPSTFDTIMTNCPYLRGLIVNKIADEVASRDISIKQLTDDLTSANAILIQTRTRVSEAEDMINMLL